MISIAVMPSRRPTGPTSESVIIRDALRRVKLENGTTATEVAQQLGVEPSVVSQYSTGHRPVPFNKAAQLADVLGIKDPRMISRAYAENIEAVPIGSAVALPNSDMPLRPDLVIARLENDVRALRYVLSALVAAMTDHRPAEATDVAEVLRKLTPQKFRLQGFVPELLATLDKVKK